MRTSRNFPFFGFKVGTTFKERRIRCLLAEIREILYECLKKAKPMTFTRILISLHKELTSVDLLNVTYTIISFSNEREL